MLKMIAMKTGYTKWNAEEQSFFVISAMSSFRSIMSSILCPSTIPMSLTGDCGSFSRIGGCIMKEIFFVSMVHCLSFGRPNAETDYVRHCYQRTNARMR